MPYEVPREVFDATGLYVPTAVSHWYSKNIITSKNWYT